MLSRRAILLLSLTISALIYLAVLALAPHVTLLAANRDVPPELIRFRVRVQPPEPEPSPEKPAPDTRNPEPSPEAIRQQLAELFGAGEETRLPDTGTPAPQQMLETEDLARRLAQSIPDRLYDPQSPEQMLQQADTRIVEISGDTARKDLDIARRLVRPSPDFILPPEQTPVFRSDAVDPGQIPLEGDFRGTVRLGEALNPQGMEQAGPALPPPPPPPPPPVTAQKLDTPAAEQEQAKTSEKIQKESDYEFLDDLVDIRISTFKDTKSDKGYFEIAVSIKQDASPKILPKDVTFVLDASSSITQRKLDLNVRGVSQALQSLRPEDRFNIVLFRDNPSFFSPQRRPATPEALAEAQKFLRGLEAVGRTDVYSALSAVIADPPRAGVPGLVIVLTDGRPTAGLQDSRTIINQVSANNRSGNTIFAFGSGNTVNRYLMDLLAYRNRGDATVEPKIERTADALLAFFEQFQDPVLIDIQTKYSQVDSSEVFPTAMPDFYLKRPVRVYGRFDPARDKEVVMRVSGRALDRRKELIFKARLDNAPAGDPNLPARWAFAKAYHIINEIARVGEQPDLLRTLQDLRQQYGVKTVYSQ
ncbi:MAG TPA: VWA domain-containing protein [Candidatus Hydrogenedentes bacterium]|nr:VWA domain-containing protein [Candidatus Hydrogenedentota bacterium]HOV59484.1 VWA domain-containing protein [Candidatus Hydrogenedentota bacterium]